MAIVTLVQSREGERGRVRRLRCLRSTSPIPYLQLVAAIPAAMPVVQSTTSSSIEKVWCLFVVMRSGKKK